MSFLSIAFFKYSIFCSFSTYFSIFLLFHNVVMSYFAIGILITSFKIYEIKIESFQHHMTTSHNESVLPGIVQSTPVFSFLTPSLSILHTGSLYSIRNKTVSIVKLKTGSLDRILKHVAVCYRAPSVLFIYSTTVLLKSPLQVPCLAHNPVSL